MGKKKEIRYNKIKIEDTGKVRLHFDLPQGEGYDRHEVLYKDAPLPELQKSLDTLAIHVAEICELPKEYAENMVIIGITLSHSKTNIMGCTITAKKTLANKRVVLINSPHLPEEPYSETGDQSAVLSVKCVKGIKLVIKQAESYRTGNRAQADMFNGKKKEAA